jgi:hypothetical protein
VEATDVVKIGLTSLATVLICACSEVFLPFFLNQALEADFFWDLLLLFALFFMCVCFGWFGFYMLSGEK